MYKDGYVPDTTARLGTAYKAAREHMEEARAMREKYYNQKSQAREFSVGDRCLVHFDVTPRSANRKFIKKWKGVYTVTDVVGKVNLKLRATPQSKPILVHVNRVKHLKQSDFHEQFDSKRREQTSDEGHNSSAEEQPQPRRRSPTRARRRRSPRPARSPSTATKPTKFTLLREQRQPAGEFRQYIQDAASDSSDFRTADESPSDSPAEAARPRQDSRGAATPMHDAVSAIEGRQARNQRPTARPAGDESSRSNQTAGEDNDDPDVTFNNVPRLTRNQARQLNLHVSDQGLPPRTRQRK